MAEAKTDDMWTPYKELCAVIQSHFGRPKDGPHTLLESALRKHKQNFLTLLKNPPRHARSRSELLRGVSDGVSLPGVGHSVALSKELVDEAIILSDMYDLNEYIALELLCTAQQQMPYHPGLPRGLVAILLYYDGRKSIATALRTLVQSRKGVSWCTDSPDDLTSLVTTYTDQLAAGGLLTRIIDLLTTLDMSKETDLLLQNRGLGPPKHHRQVLDLFEDTRKTLAGILYCWSAQTGLPKDVTLHLINYLRQVKIEEVSSGAIDDVTLTLQMALLYALDLSVLQKREDGEDMVQQLPIISESNFVQAILESLAHVQWENEGLRSLSLFAFGLALATLRLAPQSMHPPGFIDQDDYLVYTAIEMKVFDFIHHTLLENELVFKEEFYYRRLHTLITDFIDMKHAKVMDLRTRADETARTIDMYAQEGLDPPSNLSYDFELLLLIVAKLYGRDDLKLNLCTEFWGTQDNVHNYSIRSNTRTVSLIKFIRLAGDLVPNNLLQPYLLMLASLANSPEAARHTFNLLKMNGPGSSTTVSWDHFFNSLGRYYSNLRQEQSALSDTIYHSRTLPQGIRPREMAALEAVLGVIRAVAAHDEVARVALCDHPTWVPLQVLLGLVTCSVPIPFKASLLRTLSALAKSSETAMQLWVYIETSQILLTIPTASSYQPRGIQTELEEIESRNEAFPLTQAFLELLDVLTTAGIPKTLGAGVRVPGFDPYLTFIIHSVFLRFNTRIYKNPAEKWQVAHRCLILLGKFLNQYEPQEEDFPILSKPQTASTPPGFHIMVQLNSKSEFLRLVMFILDEACMQFDSYTPFPGKKCLENCTENCLGLLERALTLQQKYFSLLSSTGCSILLTGLNKLLMGMNPRSGKPDHMLNVAKYITYNSWLPKHALNAIKIITLVTALPSANAHLMGILTQSPSIKTEIRHGFVECLELEDDNIDEEEEDEGFLTNTKDAILKLLQQSLNHASPNLAHYLFGFDIHKDIKKTCFQQAGVLGFPRTCLHSLISILDSGILKGELCKCQPKLLGKCYQMMYLLCSNTKTSEPVLRFLRSCNDFLSRHVAALPFSGEKSTPVLNQMSWFMKTIAVELKVTAKNHQHSQFTNISKLLLSASRDKLAETQNTVSMELSHYYSTNDLPKLTDTHLLTDLLNYLEFKIDNLSPPRWEYFDVSLMEKLFKNCEITMYGGLKLIDVKQLHRILMDELASIQGTTAAGQRQLIIQEIQCVLRFAISFNNHKSLCAATVHYFDAWRQISEVLFCVAPAEAMTNETRQTLLLEISQTLLTKSVSIVLLPELANLASGSILVLLINLRHSYMYKQKQKLLKMLEFDVTNETVIKSNTLSLKFVLQNIIQWLITSGVSLQKLRINLYGAFLNFMQIVTAQYSNSDPDIPSNDMLYVSRLDSSRVRPTFTGESNNKQMAIEVVTHFGDKFIDVLCHDCTSGHDICRMLALSCLDILIELDPRTPWINFLSRRGYLKHLIDSLLQSDCELIKILQSIPNTLKPLYVYESKMAMLTRIGSTYVGAEMLLEQNALACLSSMRVYDLHPDPQTVIQDSNIAFIPPVAHRFQQILFPALCLCDSLITTLGSENHSAIIQIIQFLLSHANTVEVILRAGTPFLDISFLNELAYLTGVIARSANQDVCGNLNASGALQDHSAQLYRMQKLMLALLPRFILSDALNRNTRIHGKIGMLFNELQDVTEEDKTNRVLKFLEVSSNLVMYSCNIIANHSADHRSSRVLFQPTLTDNLTGQLDQTHNVYGTNEQRPSLGIIIKQLVNCVNYHAREKMSLNYLTRQKNAVPEMSTAELSEFLTNPSEMVAVNQGRDIALQRITYRLTSKQREIALVTFLIEQCLYLIWAHLDYFMLRAIPINRNLPFGDRSRGDTLMATAIEATWRVSTDDISALKTGLVGTFNETFSKELMSTTQDSSSSERNFIEALLRRIKRLVQFVPVK